MAVWIVLKHQFYDESNHFVQSMNSEVSILLIECILKSMISFVEGHNSFWFSFEALVKINFIEVVNLGTRKESFSKLRTNFFKVFFFVIWSLGRDKSEECGNSEFHLRE